MEIIYRIIGFILFWSTLIACALYCLGYINYKILGGKRKGFIFYLWEIIYIPFGLYKAYKKHNGWPLFIHYRNIRHGLEWFKIDGWRSTWSWWFCIWINSFFATKDYKDLDHLKRKKLKKIPKDQSEEE